MLGKDFKPAPMVGSLGPFVIHRLSGAESKELANFSPQVGFCLIPGNIFQHFRIRHDQGFPLPVKPKVLMPAWFIQISINILDCLPAPFGWPKSKNKRNFRCSDPDRKSTRLNPSQ